MKVSGESIAKASFTGTGEIADQESFTVKTAPKEIPDATDVSIKVSYDGSNYTVDGSFKVPKGKEPTETTDLTWETLADVSTATMNVTKLTLKGSYADGAFTVASGSYTAAKKPVTVTLNQTDIDVTGSGTASEKITALTQGSIDLNTANLKDTTTVSGATGVKITFTAAGKAKIEGTLTLASGKSDVGASVEFTKTIPVTGVTGIQSIESVTISGSGSGAQWTVSGIAINATIQAEEPSTKTITFSGKTEAAITGITGTGGTLTLDASTIQEPSGLTGNITVTIDAEQKGTFGGTVTAPKEATLGNTLTWTGSATVSGGSAQTVTKLVINGSLSGTEYKVTAATATVSP